MALRTAKLGGLTTLSVLMGPGADQPALRPEGRQYCRDDRFFWRVDRQFV